jgi:hypothetical protein
MRFAIARVFCCCLLNLGCHGLIETAASLTHVQFELHDQEGMLRLQGAPLDPTYVALYPNPSRVASMVVTMLSLGGFAATCKAADGAEVECDAPPFFSSTTRTPQGRRVRVWDSYGVLLIDTAPTPFVEPLGVSPPGECLGECGDLPEEEAPLLEEEAPLPEEEAPLLEEIPDGATPGPCEELRVEFCTQLNADLAALALPSYDCSDLGDSLDFSAMGMPPGAPPEGSASGSVSCISVNGSLAEVMGKSGGEVPSYECQYQLVNWAERARWDLQAAGVCTASPLVLDLDGGGVALSSLEGGVVFDLVGSGTPVRCAWIRPGNALLVLDRDGDGVVDGAAELFGNATAGRAFADGFAALAELDDNSDGLVDETDREFSRLRVWADPDRDGYGAANELIPLTEMGIRALETRPARVPDSEAGDEHGNRIPLVAGFVRADGRRGLLVDAYLRFAPLGE